MTRLTRHLDDVDESYFQHMQHALSFAVGLAWAAGCCLVHALFPFLCEKSGSKMVAMLHDRMVVNRHRLSPHSTRSNKPLLPNGQLRERRDDTHLA